MFIDSATNDLGTGNWKRKAIFEVNLCGTLSSRYPLMTVPKTVSPNIYK